MKISKRPKSRFRSRASRAVLACLIGATALQVGCEPHPVERILDERAGHLGGSQRSRIARALLSAEREFGVDPLLLTSVMEQESHFRAGARSRRGAVGLMQVKPATAKEVAELNNVAWPTGASLHDPHLNVHLGAAYLATLQKKYSSWDLALTAYNRGPAAAQRARRLGRNPSSRYAAQVLKRYEHFKRRYAAPATEN
jgi:soluble lytic murein transglycosylase-like protein